MNCNEQGIMQNLGLTEKIFDSRKMNRKNVMQTVEWKKHWKEVTGEAANAYVTEFEETVQTTFSRINLNITNIAEQLEKVCKEYEQMDADLRDQLN